MKCFQGRYDFIHPAFGCASEGCACGGEDGLVWHDPLAPAYRRRLFKGMRAPGGKTQGKRKRAADEDAEGEDLPPVKVSRVAALRDARGGGDDEGIDIGE